jgi:fibronectin type 3 domain-containing protein
LAQSINLTNPTGGTLTWTLSESAAWLGLNVTSGTTTTEVDSISASVSTTGLAAGTYSTAIIVAASGSTNSPQTIPVTLTLTAPTTNGTASLSWDPSTDTSLAKYNLYMGTQPGVYGPPVAVGMNTSYTAGNLTGGKTYYFSVTAVNGAGSESQHSNEVSKTIQ